MYPSFGIPELLISFFIFLLSIGLPLAILFALYAIYKKLKSIDDHLKKINDDRADKEIRVK